MRTAILSGNDALTTRHAILHDRGSGQQFELWLNRQNDFATLFVVEWRRDPSRPARETTRPAPATPAPAPAGPDPDPEPVAPARPDAGYRDRVWRLLYVLTWALLILVIGVSAAFVAQLILGFLG